MKSITMSIGVVATILIAGCASSEPIYTPDGKRGYNIDCSGGSTWGDCYQEASELCKSRGYTIIKKSSDKTSSIYGDKDFLYGGTSSNRNMLIRCK